MNGNTNRLRRPRYTRKEDRAGQAIDAGAIYVSCADILKKIRRSRTSLFNDIKSGALPAVWGLVYVNGKPNRAWLIREKDAEQYIRKFQL